MLIYQSERLQMIPFQQQQKKRGEKEKKIDENPRCNYSTDEGMNW